jgi:TRAP-type C4-dicarboxylate transport system permease small subunit
MKTLYAYLCRIESLVAQITLWTMVLLIFAAGFARLLLHPINWAIDVSTCLFAWSCFLSADIAWRENKLMNVDIMIRNFSERTRLRLRLLNYAILVGFLLYLIVFGISLSYTTRARSFQGIPGFSYTWVTLSVPVGAVCLLITTMLKFVRDIRGEDPAQRSGSDVRA